MSENNQNPMNENNQRPNSFYDVNSLQTLGGCAMAVFIVASIIRFFSDFDPAHKADFCNVHNLPFNLFVVISAFLLALVRVYGPGESLLALQKETASTPPNKISRNPQETAPKDKDGNEIKGFKLFLHYVKDFFVTLCKNTRYYFHINIIRTRNLLLVLFNAFLIISSAAGLSAVSGDSWFPSGKDKVAIEDLKKDVDKKDSLIKMVRPILADSLEREGFKYLKDKKFKQAEASFLACEKIYPTYHCAYDIQLLIKKNRNSIDDTTTQRKIIDTILNNIGRKYDYKMPDSTKMKLSNIYNVPLKKK